MSQHVPAHAWLAMYRDRKAMFGDISEGPWRILLDLAVNGPCSVTSACLASGSPATTGLRYVAVTDDDHWVDDPRAPQYNQWVVGAPGVSAERLRRDDGQYDVAAVLEYNTDPVVPGNGSAIFLHVWSAPGQSTSGCVAAAEADVRRLLGWLDRAQRPVCVVVADG